MNEELVEKKLMLNLPKLWKMSHGKSGSLSERDHEWMVSNCYVTLGYGENSETGKSQGKKFAEIRSGDYFYLVRNAAITLLGRFSTSITEESPEHLESVADWYMRKFEVVKEPASPFASKLVEGSQYWKPTGNSTLHQVPPSELAAFEAVILLPAFGMRLNELSSLPIGSPAQSGASSPPVSKALNRILYGPPGTGKTFRTVHEALSIIENNANPAGEYSEQKKRFDDLRQDGRIAFVTFHQSFSYEDFIEGIRAESVKGVLSYNVKDGIFKKLAITAMHQDPVRGKISREPEFNDVYHAFLNEVRAGLPYGLKSAQGKDLQIQSITERDTLKIIHGDNTIEHPVGKGRVEDLYNAYPTLAKLQEHGVQAAITNVIGGANVTVYWAVLSRLLNFKEKNWSELALAATEVLDEAEIEYEEKKRRVLAADKFSPNGKPYVLIIDEINRGNISRVFGELITLIETSKRAGSAESTEVLLPYSNDPFSVPSNLYIIGTMNTADRSLAVLDTALRRRFDFIEMMPDPDVLKVKNVAGVDLVHMLQSINMRIEHLYDREHTIGHSFFMSLTAQSTIDDLATIFKNNVLPLLEEYFYEDWEKIDKILGKSGIYELQASADLGFSPSSKVYRRNLKSLELATTYQSIYGWTDKGASAGPVA